MCDVILAMPNIIQLTSRFLPQNILYLSSSDISGLHRLDSEYSLSTSETAAYIDTLVCPAEMVGSQQEQLQTLSYLC